MNPQPFVPPKTREILSSPPVPGTRHNEMKDIALSLIGNGFHPDAVFIQLRNRYPSDVPDAEISGVLQWVSEKNPQPSVPRSGGTVVVPFRTERPGFYQTEPKTVTAAVTDPANEARKLIRSIMWKESVISQRSEPLPDWSEHFSHLLCCCYDLHEKVNVVTRYGLRENKAFPDGKGSILSIEEWIDKGVSGSEAGGWMRMNPVSDGVADENVTAFRFVLLENDVLPPELQLNLLVRLPLPISALLWSGGVSYHAWVRVDCPNLDTYRATSQRLLKTLERFGFDQANKNPSRLSRLPGVERKIGVKTDGRQRLIYLNSSPKPEPILC